MSTGWRSEHCHEHFGGGPDTACHLGATGMVGGYALRYALDHPVVGPVTEEGRRLASQAERGLVPMMRPPEDLLAN
jgi:hypothetical protein